MSGRRRDLSSAEVRRRDHVKGRLCEPTACGGFTVDIKAGGTAGRPSTTFWIYVNCQRCGNYDRFSAIEARSLAAVLVGPLGRFETPAPRAERIRLAGLLKAAALELDGRRDAAIKAAALSRELSRAAARARAARATAWQAPCGCVYQRPRRSTSLNAPCSQHDYRTNAAAAMARAERSKGAA